MPSGSLVFKARTVRRLLIVNEMPYPRPYPVGVTFGNMRGVPSKHRPIWASNEH